MNHGLASCKHSNETIMRAPRALDAKFLAKRFFMPQTELEIAFKYFKTAT